MIVDVEGNLARTPGRFRSSPPKITDNIKKSGLCPDFLLFSYNFHSIFLIIVIIKIPIRTAQKKKNVPLNPNTPTKNPPIMSPKTFARLRIILSGAAEALESISTSFCFVAYT